MNKLYFKNIKLINVNYKKIIKKNEHKKSIQHIILTNKGYYIFIKKNPSLAPKLYNIKMTLNILNENDEYVILNEIYKKKNVYQIPMENIIIKKEK